MYTLASNTAFFFSFLVHLTREMHTSLKKSLHIISEFHFDPNTEAAKIRKFHEMLY